MENKKTLTASIILLTIVFAQIVAFGIAPANAAATTVTNTLKIYAGPTSIPADNQAYNIIAVQLQNSKGSPLRATSDTEIRLSSSETNVGSVDEIVIIPEGATTAFANFYASYSPGATTVTATASGYPNAQVTITTVAPAPTKLSIYAFPSILPADGGNYQALFVQLQDASGNPANAPVGGVQVTLSSSNGTTFTVDSTTSIEEGSSYALASVKTGSVGTATITATASDYTSAQTTLSIQKAGSGATAIKVYLAPPKIQADGNAYRQIAVELQDAKGKLAQAQTDTTITLASSNTAVASVDSSVTISAGQTFGVAEFITTYKAGSTTITAAATNFTTNQATLTTTGSAPAKLAVYTIPTALPADAQPCEAIRVQLQDGGGKPTRDPTQDTTVYLSTSTPDAGNVTEAITIPMGQTQATGTFTATCAAGVSTITAQASGYTSGTAKLTTYLIDTVFVNVTVAADPDAVKPGNQTTIKAYVSYNGTGPATHAIVTFASNKGGNFTAVKEEGNGYYTSTFTAPKSTTPTNCSITANATKTGYNSTIGKTQVTVDLNLAQAKGTMTMRVLADGTPVGAATVTSQTVPTGVQALSGTTNASGYVIFRNIPSGSYTLQVAKDGYQTTTQTVQFSSSQAKSQTMNLSKQDANGILVPLAAGIAAAAAAIVVTFLYIRRRRSTKVEAEDPQKEKRDKPKKK